MIAKRPYCILRDNEKVHDFMSGIYEKDCRNGMSAPFFDYAQVYPDFCYPMSHQIMLWEDDGEIVAMSWYEVHIDNALLSLKPGYEALIDEMIDHAEAHIHKPAEPAAFWLSSKQTAIRERLAERGYAAKDRWVAKIYDFAKGDLPYALPEGYRFLDNQTEEIDARKLHDCAWRGFDHGDEPDDDIEFQRHFATSPYFRGDLSAIVVSGTGEYVCYAGMWHDAPNRLAYLEPLCTVPAHRKKGLAAAAIALHVKRMRALGCDHITGGDNEFYTRIGYDVYYTNEIWKKA